jgi:hypothetical protein
MAACWKLVWNVDPLPLRVPVSGAAVGEEPPLGALFEEHAERDTATARAAMPPTMVACFLPRGCMSFLLIGVFILLLPE